MTTSQAFERIDRSDDHALVEIDLLAPLPAERAADGSRTTLPAAPPPIPAAALHDAAPDPSWLAMLDDLARQPLPQPPPPRVRTRASLPPPLRPPSEPIELDAGIADELDFEPTPLPAPMPFFDDVDDELADIAATVAFDRAPAPTRRRIPRRAMLIGACSLGVLSLAFLFWPSSSSQLRTPPRVAPAAPAPVPVPVPVPVPAPPPALSPSLVRTAITSHPSGASVTLVDNGRTAVLGATPVDVSLDPTRAYDVILTLRGHPAKLAHFSPRTTPALALDLGGVSGAPPPPPAPAPVRASTPPPAPAAASAARGTLAISTKPPCDIVVDGKPTHLVTPQRALPLSAGKHHVVLVNAQRKLRRELDVDIAARRTTKVIRDFMSGK